MNKKILDFVKSNDIKVIIFDIDGTIKDLCTEHTNAVKKTLEKFNVKKINKKIMLALNKFAMYIVKTGIIPTNHLKQNFLLKVYAIFCGIKILDFYEVYFENYTSEVCLFDGVYEMLEDLSKEQEVYFATINKQNYNLETCKFFNERISYTESSFKAAAYSRIIKSLNLDKSQVLIVGDNIVDDLFSAKQLDVKCILVNRYKSRFKSLVCKCVNGECLK